MSERGCEECRALVKEEIREEIGHLREKIDIRLEAAEEALRLQAREYSRRLEELNHEKERLKEAAATYVSYDVYRTHRAADKRQSIYIGVSIMGLVVAVFSIIMGWVGSPQ